MKICPCVRTDRQDEANSRFSTLMHLIRSHFLYIFSQTQKVSLTQVGYLVDTRPLGVTLIQVDSKQRNNIFAFFYRV